MTWYEISIAFVTALGGVEAVKYVGNMIFNRKNNSRINDTVATNAEIEVEKNKAMSAVEAKEAAEDAHAKQCKQFEERISDLHGTIDRLNEQLDGYVARAAANDAKYAEQTELLRTVQRDRLDVERDKAVMEVEYLKLISELELDLQKKRCDNLLCPYRQPPTAHTPPKENTTIDEYFATREINIPIDE